MPSTLLPIATGFYESGSLPVSAQRGVNCFPHIPDATALNAELVWGTPGIHQVATLGASAAQRNRGAHVLNGTPYFVNGNNLLRLEVDNTLTNLGTIENNIRVSMADNGIQLMILVPGGKGYIFTESPDTLTEITDPDFRASGNPQYVVFIDSFFCSVTDDNKFIISASNDGLSYNALDFGTAESSPDAARVPFVYKNQLFILGETTVEAFTNTGGVDFPFQRSGLFLDEGVTAPFSVITAENTFMWIGAGENEGPAIWSLAGNDAAKISTQAVDNLLGDLSSDELASVYAWSYGEDGHYFVGFVLPTTVIVFDSSTGRWHERLSRIANADSTFSNEAWRVASIIQARGRIYVGDSKDGRIGVLDITAYREYGEQIERWFVTQPFQANMMPFTVPRLELTVESGVGNSDTVDPQVTLEISRDGGKTWGEPRARSIGKQGEYKKRAVWRRNGRTARFDVYRFRCAAAVKFVAIQLTGDIQVTSVAA